jgi:hypothetical protein
MKFDCPLDIFAHYLKYPTSFTAYLKSNGYLGYVDAGHKRIFAIFKAKQKG